MPEGRGEGRPNDRTQKSDKEQAWPSLAALSCPSVFPSFSSISLPRLPKDRNRHRGYCYLTFATEQAAVTAVQTKNKQTMMGRFLDVQLSTSELTSKPQGPSISSQFAFPCHLASSSLLFLPSLAFFLSSFLSLFFFLSFSLSRHGSWN